MYCVHDMSETFHGSDVTWVSWHLKSLPIQLFVQQFVQVVKKGKSKHHITGNFLGESTGEQWIPLTKGQ